MEDESRGKQKRDIETSELKGKKKLKLKTRIILEKMIRLHEN